MRGWVLSLLLGAGVAGLGWPVLATTCGPRFAATANSLLNDSATHWAVLIQSAPGKTLYAYQPQRLLVPASNTKILTTAAVLTRLGSGFQIRTSIYQVATPPDRVVLRLVGRGDPGFTDVQLENLVQQLRQRGITRIDQFFLEERYFSDPATNPTWGSDDFADGYIAPLSGLILNQNQRQLKLYPREPGQPLQIQWEDNQDPEGWVVINQTTTTSPRGPEYIAVTRDLDRHRVVIEGQLRAGSQPDDEGITVLHPVDYFIAHLRQALATAHISVGSIQVATGPAPQAETEIAAVESPPLADLVATTNHESNNFYAEALMRVLGRTMGLPGVEAVGRVLTNLGVDPHTYHLEDGSGLSHQNYVSPEALVETLTRMAQGPQGPAFMASLSTAGESGTLKDRFRDTPLQGEFLGKTGTLSGVASLSGYLLRPGASPWVVSIIGNGASSSSIRSHIDQLLLTLDRDCSLKRP